jgi:uncharacterized protein YqgC (DUF456 family)
MFVLIGLLLTLLSAGCVFLVVLGLPGTWMMAAFAGLFAWWQWDPSRGPTDQFLGVPVLIAVLGLALVGEIVEFAAGAAGAKRAGASGWGAIGALIGALVGGLAATFMIPIPIVGSLIGACGGAAAGAWICELAIGRPHEQAVRSGIGAGVGRFKGTLAKLAVAVVMWLVIAVAAFWP